MSDAPRYTIKTVADFFSVPEEKRSHCLTDFRLWLSMVSEARKLFADIEGVVIPTDKFVWIDDGKHDAHITTEIVNDRSARDDR